MSIDMRQIGGFLPSFNNGSFGVTGQIGDFGTFSIMANNQAQIAAAFALAAAQATAIGNFSLAASLAAAANLHSGQASHAASLAAAFAPRAF